MQWEIIIAAAIGGIIAIAGGFFTNRWQNKRQREKDDLDRHLFIYQQAIDAFCYYLDILRQKYVISGTELEKWREQEKGARVQHWKTVAYLRMFGDDDLADETVSFFNYLSGLSKEDLQEKWDSEITPKSYELLNKVERHVIVLQGKTITCDRTVSTILLLVVVQNT